ncbi:MAG: phosphate ABC transporter ATP-binding protein [Methanomicrobiales archaeon]
MSSSEEARIRIEEYHMTIGDKPILTDISVEIPANRITAIIGPSGCGKSTLLRSMNRMVDLIEEVDVTGSITIDGLSVFDRSVDVTELRRRVGMISQSPNPLPMSIYDNVAYGLKIHGVRDRTQKDETVERYLRLVGLWEEVSDRLKEPASALSLGQQQRLCLARTLAIEPEVILCDETTSALDPISANKIEQELLALKEDYTIVFVTHILRQAKRLADYVIFLYLGELVEHGPAEQVFNDPRDPRTKAYVEGTFG